jgi:hypothetical protein
MDVEYLCMNVRTHELMCKCVSLSLLFYFTSFLFMFLLCEEDSVCSTQ